MPHQYHCAFQGRAAALRAAAQQSPPVALNGIDYLEVAPDHSTLELHFVHDLSFAPAIPLREANVEIRGGVRVRDPRVTRVVANGNVLTVHVDAAGDFSTYRLRLVASAQGSDPPEGIDPAMAQIEFSFKVDCPNPFDCNVAPECAPAVEAPPQIDYLAKDYSSFRRLMLDRLSALMPDWRERSPADLMVTLVELLAFRADELSYYQDAVAAEAYLGTARRRTSVRRHARLLDYPFDDGANARVWVVFEVEPGGAADGLTLTGCNPITGIGGTLLTTKLRGTEAPVIDETKAAAALAAAAAQPFELLHDIELRASHNQIEFHTWSDEECCLPKGSTSCYLRDDPQDRLQLRAGSVVIFEELRDSQTGQKADADRTHRHAVRLTRAAPEAGAPVRVDPVTGKCFVEIEWGAEDALPFPLCLSARVEGALITDVAVTRANVALADHGRTLEQDETLRAPEGVMKFLPQLEQTAVRRLTLQRRIQREGSEALVLMDETASATSAMSETSDRVLAAIDLRSDSDGSRWEPRADLIDSNRFDGAFVVEMEADGRSFLRFGDDINGRRPRGGEVLNARYRIGNGGIGNVGSDSVRHLVGAFHGIRSVRNPMAGQGGREPHAIDQVKLYAPQAFRKQERAVTLEDYARTAERHPEVQRAVATRRWTGSWHTVFLTVDRISGLPIDTAFEADLRAFLERFRLAGHDLEIDAPRFVALDLAFDVCAKPGYFTSDIQQRLLRVFTSGMQADGTPGFFHPDFLTFGASVSLSSIIARAMQVPGVDFVTPRRFRRWGRTEAGELDAGRIRMGRLEIARLDNDANAPENGKLEFSVHAAAEARRA